MIIQSALAMLSSLCPPDVVAYDLRGDRSTVIVKNNCGSTIDLEDYTVRVGVWSWAESASVEVGELGAGECRSYTVSHEGLDEDKCGAAIGVFDDCDDVNVDAPLVSVSTAPLCGDMEADEEQDGLFWWSEDAWSCVSFGLVLSED